MLSGHCEVAQRLAERLGFGLGVVRNLGQLYERWDGRGLPHGLKGEAVAPAVRVVTLAQDVIVLADAHGIDGAIAIVRKRRGRIYDPRFVDYLVPRATELIEGLAQQSSWDAVLALDRDPRALLSQDELDAACLAMADFIDIKSPFTLGHSRAVAALAEAAARNCGLPESDVIVLRRAGLMHDVGKAAVATQIMIKPGPLSDGEWERVRLHPYHTERILARPQALARLGLIAGQHKERLDGSGYHRGSRANALSPAGRILAAADCYQAKLEPRPYRGAMTAEAAAANLRAEVRAGLIDSEAAAAVLAAAGHRVPPVRRDMIAGLTAREIDVRRLIARGKSMKQIGAALGIAAKTVDNHIQNLYGKIDVKTRAGATLFAIEHGLLGDEAQN
jgi:HD-GYP domain-containing protein (c-di-GMP phosphodiesterase class II)/DNA-binding CsgD family transcriptional regulator